MPSRNFVSSDKMQIPAHAAAAGAVGDGATVGGGGKEIIQHHHRQWFPDERDGVIHWLRGEFAAANAVIDSLCHHLREIGEIGEYEAVIASIQQRRYSWNPVLHMQQYVPVSDVSYALQQAAWRRKQRLYDQGKLGGKDYKRSGIGFKGNNRIEMVAKEVQNSMVDYDVNSTVLSTVSERNDKVTEKWEDKGSAITEDKTEDDLHSSQNQNGKKNHAKGPKTFVGNEILDGKMVNVVDGLKLYEELFDKKEVSNLVSLVNDLKVAGRRGQLQDHTYVASKKPMMGLGREMIRLGLPVADAPLDDETAEGTSKDRRTEAVPALLQDAIKRLVELQVMTAKPDSCIIDFYNEGDHSQPRTWPPWFGKPVCLVFLTECEITFGRVIAVDRPGDFRGSLKLSLSPGSLLVMEGKSADFAKHALPSVQKQRILVTFTKYQPKKSMSDNQRLPLPSDSRSSQWGMPPSRSSNYFRHSASPKHYAAIPTGVLPGHPIRPQVPPTNGVFIPVQPGSTGWPPAPPRHSSPHLPVPGTGVFLPPPVSGNLSSQELPTAATELNIPIDSTSPEARSDRKSPNEDCNGSLDGTGSDLVTMKEEQQSVDSSVN